MNIKRSQGYTLVELIIAMAIFNAVFLILIAGILGLLHTYQSGLAIRATQQNARFAMEQISRDSRQAARWETGPNEICLYTSPRTPKVIIYYIDTSETLRRFVDDRTYGTSSCTMPAGAGEKITDENVLTKELQARNSSGDGRLVQLTLTVGAQSGVNYIEYSSADDYWRCKPGVGSQWCSLTRLETSVTTRSEVN